MSNLAFCRLIDIAAEKKDPNSFLVQIMYIDQLYPIRLPQIKRAVRFGIYSLAESWHKIQDIFRA